MHTMMNGMAPAPAMLAASADEAFASEMRTHHQVKFSLPGRTSFDSQCQFLLALEYRLEYLCTGYHRSTW